MSKVHSHHRISRQILFFLLWLTLLALAIKVWAGWATRSLSLLAESLLTLLDCFSIFLSLISLQTVLPWQGQELRTHRDYETAVVLLLVALLGFCGISLLSVSVYQAVMIDSSSPLPASTMNLPLLLLLGAVVTLHFCLILFERYESRMLDSIVLRLNATYMLHNTWLTLLTLLGLAGISAGYQWLDEPIAILVLLGLLPALWRLLNLQLPSLVSEVAIAPEVLAQLAVQVEGITQCCRVRSHGLVGRQVFVKMYVLLHPEFMATAHLIGIQIERILREHYGPVQASIYVKDSAGHYKQWQSLLRLKRQQRP